MTDLRARRNALRGAEISVVELLFHTRTSVDRDDIRHEKTSKKHCVEVCLKHLKDRLKKLSTPRADKELSMMEAAEESYSLEWYLRRNAKRLFNVLGSKLTGDEWAKLLGLSLALAAANREKTVATKLINAGAAIASVVHAAVRGGSKDMVNFLLENGSSTSDLDFRGETPLHAAGRAGKLEIARLLLLRGADKNAMSSAGGTPLYWAARHGHTAVAEALLAAGADTTIRYTEGELSPLDAAVGFGYTGVMRALIEHGADVNAAGSEGQTALYWSIYANKAKAIDVLAEAGADMEARKSAGNLAGLAPLHLALHWLSFDAAFAKEWRRCQRAKQRGLDPVALRSSRSRSPRHGRSGGSVVENGCRRNYRKRSGASAYSISRAHGSRTQCRARAMPVGQRYRGQSVAPPRLSGLVPRLSGQGAASCWRCFEDAQSCDENKGQCGRQWRRGWRRRRE